jgi:hypothetical protein
MTRVDSNMMSALSTDLVDAWRAGTPETFNSLGFTHIC